MSSNARPVTSRKLPDLIREDIPYDQRCALIGLLDEIAIGIAVVARVSERWPDEPAAVESARSERWGVVAAGYARLLEAVADSNASGAVPMRGVSSKPAPGGATNTSPGP